MLVRCWVRPRARGGYIAEGLEVGIYYVEETAEKGRAMLAEAVEAYRAAVRRFEEKGLPVHAVRVPGYPWKRLAWGLARAVFAGMAFSCEVAVPAGVR